MHSIQNCTRSVEQNGLKCKQFKRCKPRKVLPSSHRKQVAFQTKDILATHLTFSPVK